MVNGESKSVTPVVLTEDQQRCGPGVAEKPCDRRYLSNVRRSSTRSPAPARLGHQLDAAMGDVLRLVNFTCAECALVLSFDADSIWR